LQLATFWLYPVPELRTDAKRCGSIYKIEPAQGAKHLTAPTGAALLFFSGYFKILP